MRLTMTTKLVVTCSALLALAIAGISGLAILQARQMAEENFAEASAQQLRQVDHSLTGFLQQIAQDVAYLADDPLVREAYGELTRYTDATERVAMTPARNGEHEAALFSRFTRFAEHHPALAYVYLATADGGYVAWPQGEVGAGYDPRERPFYRAALERPGEVVRTDAYYFAPDDASIVSSVRTVEDVQGEVIGVQGMDVSLDGLTQMIRGIEFGEQGYLMVVEASGTVLVNPQVPEQNFRHVDSLDSPQLAALHAAARSGEAHGKTVTLDGTAYQATVYGSPGLGWTLIGLIPRAEMLAAADRLTLTLAVLGLGVIALCVGISLGLARYLTGPIRRVSQRMADIASGEGDLTQRLPARGSDEVGELAARFNAFIDRIHDVMRDVRHSSEAVRLAAGEVTDGGQDLSRRTDSSVASLQQTSASMEQIAGTVAHTTASSREADALAQAMSEVAQRSGQAVAQVVATMDEIRATSDKIGEIVNLIDGIAFQTNLLALNASVEAARAGEHGQGFAVVAAEVRQLATRSGEASRSIRSLIQASGDTVLGGSEQVRAAGATIEELVSRVTRLTQMLGEISVAAGEQRDGIDQVNQAVNELDRMTQQNAALVGQSTAAAAQLGEQADRLSTLVAGFRLREEAQS
ncbi:methyl-accepting chemotaxis protein [Billgrantia azerbaijanica]|nr:methyl-accepting chemotaxis protein [Halomonas azerbaijanica]